MSEARLDRAAFCARLGLDETAARAALDAQGTQSRSPVYVQALLASGAWIAAILVVAFVLVLLSLVIELDLERAAPGIAVLGALIFAAGAALQRGRPADGFAHHFAGALLAGGALLAPIAVGFETESFWAAAVTAGLATAAAVLVTQDRAAQFLAAALTAGLVAGGFVDAELPYLMALAALAAVAGALLLVYPPRRDLGPTAAVLLLFLPSLMAVLIQGAFSIGIGGGDGPGMGVSGLGARAIVAALLLWLLHLHRRLSSQATIDGTTALLGLSFLAVAILLPPGGSAALVPMMLGFVLGRRGLAAVGALLEIYFVSRFYYDLDATLIAKSLILMAVGAVMLGAYALVVRRAMGTRP